MSLAAAERARSEPQALALADERIELGWARLDELLNRAANALLAADVGDGRRIGVFAHNSAETALAYLAGLEAGISPIPINFHLTADEVAYILEDAGAGLLFVGPETAAVGLAAAARASVARVVGWRCDAQGVTRWEDWLAQALASAPPGDRPPRPFLHYTSGTTGKPKGAETPPTMFPRTSTVAEFFAAMREQVAAAAPGPGLAVGPLYHTGPLGSVRQLGGGKPLVVMSRFDPERVLETIERRRISSTLMVPTHFQRLLALPAETRARYDVSSLRWVAHTGAACPRDVKQRMIDWFGPVLVEAYGGTESGTTNLINAEEWLKRPGSVGKTLPPFELLVVGEDGTPLGAGEVGQLYFRDTTGRGIIYHNDPEKTRAAHLAPGVFTLGEVGYVDEDGYVFITDRVSDMIVSGGVNIYPAEAEQVLIRHPDVADVAVIGAPNAEMGEEVKALVIARDADQPPSFASLDAHCRAHLAGYKCPRSFEFVSDLGRNAMGKINKRALRRRYWPTERTIGG
ncbi:MAG TPA: AMP-binding protein [Caulobacteraceae bacterium]|nr:AMP-binding protein [Caulobacteraceae bacterium]